MAAERQPYESIDDIAHRIVGIWNPQHEVDGEPGEAEILRAVLRWLDARKIPYTSDVRWGVHAQLESPGGRPDKPGVLLAAHLDSDCLAATRDGMSAIELDRERRELRFKPEVGLDCKTGVAIALSVLERLRTGELKGCWQVHVLFTVGEESGQKGAIRAPLPRLLAGKVRHAIVIDRKTGGSAAPRRPGTREYLRHVVNKYKGVHLLDPRCEQEMMELLKRGMKFAGEETERVPAIESPNCADALELRGRWDAEVLAPRLLKHALPEGVKKNIELAVQEYKQVTKEIVREMDRIPPEDRVSSMYSHPRITRYEAMQRVYAAIHRSPGDVGIDPSLWFSCVNLSYDYCDSKPSCSIAELERTASIVVGFTQAYFEDCKDIAMPVRCSSPAALPSRAGSEEGMASAQKKSRVPSPTAEFFTWSMEEAREKAFSQSGASNCGATALLNVLSALSVPVPNIRAAEKAVHTNSRKYRVSVSEYLAARSVAGCTGENIVSGCEEVAGSSVESRFFAFYPPRDVDLQRWLAGWLEQGCSAVATLNTQAMYDADYWHHQMIFGVSSRGVCVTNGIEVMSFDEICKGLESPSVLRVRAGDAMDCSPFDAEMCDKLGSKWAGLSVTKQLQDLKQGHSQEDYVCIPAAYRSGITVFARKGSPATVALRQAPELPLRAAEPTGAPAAACGVPGRAAEPKGAPAARAAEKKGASIDRVAAARARAREAVGSAGLQPAAARGAR